MTINAFVVVGVGGASKVVMRGEAISRSSRTRPLRDLTVSMINPPRQRGGTSSSRLMTRRLPTSTSRTSSRFRCGRCGRGLCSGNAAQRRHRHHHEAGTLKAADAVAEPGVPASSGCRSSRTATAFAGSLALVVVIGGHVGAPASIRPLMKGYDPASRLSADLEYRDNETMALKTGTEKEPDPHLRKPRPSNSPGHWFRTTT